MHDVVTEQYFENEAAELVVCQCGGAYLTVGSVTLHLEKDELHQVGHLLGAAVEALQADEKKKMRKRKNTMELTSRKLH